LSVFIDSSVWFAAAVARDHDNARAKSILASTMNHVTTDHVLVETWLLLNSRYRRDAAERFWDRIRQGGVRVEPVTAADLEAAWAIGQAFADQDFSLVDRTSFAVMERLNIVQAASFDKDFAIYRYGRGREKAFEVIRSGHSEAFGFFTRPFRSESRSSAHTRDDGASSVRTSWGISAGRRRRWYINSAARARGGCRPKGNGAVSISPRSGRSRSAAVPGTAGIGIGRASAAWTSSISTSTRMCLISQAGNDCHAPSSDPEPRG